MKIVSLKLKRNNIWLFCFSPRLLTTKDWCVALTLPCDAELGWNPPQTGQGSALHLSNAGKGSRAYSTGSVSQPRQTKCHQSLFMIHNEEKYRSLYIICYHHVLIMDQLTTNIQWNSFILHVYRALKRNRPPCQTIPWPRPLFPPAHTHSHVLHGDVLQDLAVIHIPHGLVVPHLGGQQYCPKNNALPVGWTDIYLCIC